MKNQTSFYMSLPVSVLRKYGKGGLRGLAEFCKKRELKRIFCARGKEKQKKTRNR